MKAPPGMDRDAAKVRQQRRQPNNSDLGSENERIKQQAKRTQRGRNGMAIALTRVRLQPSGPEVRSTRETSKEVP